MLPWGDMVDAGRLARVFDDTTNSYKFLLFLALLDAVEEGYGGEGESRIPRRRLALGMLENAWYPRVHFRLSFGLQDRMGGFLDRFRGLRISFDRRGRLALREHLEASLSATEVRGILRYVVWRLLRPWFAEDLRGRKDAEVDRVLEALASERFDTSVPLYRAEPDALVLHPAWREYLRRNLAVVRGWASWHWAVYMQSRNPHVPAVPEKLFPPLERASLHEQTRFWRTAMAAREIRCLYSGISLNPGNSALDHFLPWTFVAHDRLWNLVPVSREANSSKGDCLPDRRYLENLLTVQVCGLVAARESVPGWARVVEPYVADLRVPAEVLLDARLQEDTVSSALREAYARTLPALLDLAEGIGFAPGWEWRRG